MDKKQIKKEMEKLEKEFNEAKSRKQEIAKEDQELTAKLIKLQGKYEVYQDMLPKE